MCSAARVDVTVLNVQPAATAVFETLAALALEPPPARTITSTTMTARTTAPAPPAIHGTGSRALRGSCRSTRRRGAWTLRGGGGVRDFLATADYGIKPTI